MMRWMATRCKRQLSKVGVGLALNMQVEGTTLTAVEAASMAVVGDAQVASEDGEVEGATEGVAVFNPHMAIR